MTELQAMKYPRSRALALCAWNSLQNPWCETEIEGDGYVFQALRTQS